MKLDIDIKRFIYIFRFIFGHTQRLKSIILFIDNFIGLSTEKKGHLFPHRKREIYYSSEKEKGFEMLVIYSTY